MSAYLIAGAPGSGKTTVGEKLAASGYQTIDTDNYPGFTNWVNKHTHEKVNPPETGMSREWLQLHDYLWDLDLLNAKIKESRNQDLIFYGSSSNQSDLLEMFEKVFLLEVNPDTLVKRLKSRQNNKYGKVQSEIDHLLSWYSEFQEDYKHRGVIVVDAIQSIEYVVSAIKNHIEKF